MWMTGGNLIISSGGVRLSTYLRLTLSYVFIIKLPNWFLFFSLNPGLGTTLKYFNDIVIYTHTSYRLCTRHSTDMQP